MKKYFCVSDIHSFYAILINTLEENEFDINNNDHMLIVCGDAFDRGEQFRQLFNFLVKLQKYNRLIYVRGNHEDLLLDCIEEIKSGKDISLHHYTNGTMNTISQFCNINLYDLALGVVTYKDIQNDLFLLITFINSSVDYYELDNYIFVHG